MYPCVTLCKYSVNSKNWFELVIVFKPFTCIHNIAIKCYHLFFPALCGCTLRVLVTETVEFFFLIIEFMYFRIILSTVSRPRRIGFVKQFNVQVIFFFI